MLRRAALALLCSTCACSPTPSPVVVALTTGHEADAFDAEPSVLTIRVEAQRSDGLVASETASPGDEFDLGLLASGTPLSFTADGFDANGARVLAGRTLGGIDASSVARVPLFAQRTASWARPPGELLRAHRDAPAAIYGERYVVSSGGTKALSAAGAAATTTSEFYDLFTLSARDSAPFPIAATALAIQVDFALIIGDQSASFVDFAAQTTADASLPPGLSSFADVAYGRTVTAPDGTAYIVGATRSSPSSDKVIAFAPSGEVSTFTLTAPRAAAAAAWIEGVGLVVSGGSPTAPGVERLAEGTVNFTELEFPPDATRGAAIVPVGGDTPHVAIVGGHLGDAAAPTRTFDPRCTSQCSITTRASLEPSAALSETWAFATANARAIVLGNDATPGAMLRAFAFDFGANTTIEIPLREARSGATPVALPNGTLGVLGGIHPDGSPALTLETLLPE
jgi:hypothetical protein